jgi:hypothetical protein
VSENFTLGEIGDIGARGSRFQRVATRFDGSFGRSAELRVAKTSENFTAWSESGSRVRPYDIDINQINWSGPIFA